MDQDQPPDRHMEEREAEKTADLETLADASPFRLPDGCPLATVRRKCYKQYSLIEVWA